MKQFQVQAQIGSVGTLKDRTLKLTIYTARELPPEETALLFDLADKEGWFMFAENSFQSSDLPEVEAEFKTAKTASERLRNTLYVLWEKKTEGLTNPEPFEDWRKKQMERIINRVKNLIDEENK